MNEQINLLDKIKRIGTGLAFLIFPLIYIFAFATHTGLLNPKFLTPLELISRLHNNSILHLGHALVTLSTGLLVVVAIHFLGLLKNKPAAWYGFIGGVLAVFGALMLAVDKGALCLTMSALDSLSKDQFAGMMPGLISIFLKEGYLFLTWGFLFLPIGFAIQTIGLLKSRSLPLWQGLLFLIGVLFIGTPDGVEIINLTASILIAIACIPYGLKMIVNSNYSTY